MLESVSVGQFAALLPRIEAIDAAASTADGYSSLGDAARRDLAHPHARAFGLLADDAAYGHAWPAPNAPDGGRFEMAVTVAPGARAAGTRAVILRELVDRVGREGGSHLIWWMPGADAASDADARSVGLAPVRDLLRMETALPHPEPVPHPSGIALRPFIPGTDDFGWLTLNNEAFSDHPEQGGWTPEMLVARCTESWFDPEIFIVAEASGVIVGANWLRRHPGGEAEIFVIAVRRSHRGLGLGRTLALAGLAAAARTGSTRASLYCAAGNTSARRLYSELGFRVTRIDRAYETALPNR